MLKVTRNKEGNLDNHKDLRANQEVGMSVAINFIFYMSHPVKTGRDSCCILYAKKNQETDESVSNKRIR